MIGNRLRVRWLNSGRYGLSRWTRGIRTKPCSGFCCIGITICVRVPHLASHLLGQVARRIDADWQAKYGHGVELLETFVDRDRFQGTCYQAAGWLRVGVTTGRGRNDRQHASRVPAKDIYVLALSGDFRRRLCA